MAEGFEIKDVPDLRAALLRRHSDAATVGRAVRDGMGVLMKTLARAGVTRSGPPFLVTHGEMDDPSGLDLELGVPVEGLLAVQGDVVEGVLVGGTVASTIHVGSYRSIGRTYGALTSWIADQGREIAGPPVEIYLSDPDDTPPEALRTEVRFTLRSARGFP
jgi:effector-binding domain-containing protein